MKSYIMIMSKFEYIGHVPILRLMFRSRKQYIILSVYTYIFNIIVIIRSIMLAT